MLDRILSEGRLTRDPSEVARAKARGLIEEFVDRVVDHSGISSFDVTQRIVDAIAELVTPSVPSSTRLCITKTAKNWRQRGAGLHSLVMNTETSTRLKLRLLNVSKADLAKDLKSAVEFDQSALFKKVYEDEYGTFGGNPYSVLIGDYEFGPGNEDVLLLGRISNVAAAAHAPFIASASPTMFFMDGFTELPSPRDLAKIFESSDFTDWRAFRATEDSRYVALTLPRVLQRLPYGPNTVPVEGMSFVEDVDGTDHKKYLWGSAAYKLAQCITSCSWPWHR